MQALIGTETGRRDAIEEVSASEIRRFAQATFDENPLYYDAEAGRAAAKIPFFLSILLVMPCWPKTWQGEDAL